MKKIRIPFSALVLTLIWFSTQTYAQDVIYKSDGSPIECQIERIDGTSIFYFPNKKSSKSQSIKTIQTSLVVFENGQYALFPDPKVNAETLKGKKKLDNDVVITRFAEIIEGKLGSVTDNKVEITNNQNNTQSSFIGDEVIMVIYSSGGGHKIFKNATEVKPMLEYMQPQILALVDVKKQDGASAKQEVATGRPAHLGGSTTTSPIGEIDSNKNYQNDNTNHPVPQTYPEVQHQITQDEYKYNAQTSKQANATATYASSSLYYKSPSELTDIDFDEFSDKALQKIDDFTNYLGIISSKETYPESANQAIDLAIELFVSEDVVVEVSTTGFNASVKRKIRDYLNRLKLLKYDKVDIQWADINYVSNFRKAPDGNYYGTVSVKQTFRGYKDNQVVYSDVTQKDVEVVIKGMEKSIDGQKEMVWDVLLSDIGVVDTK